MHVDHRVRQVQGAVVLGYGTVRKGRGQARLRWLQKVLVLLLLKKWIRVSSKSQCPLLKVTAWNTGEVNSLVAPQGPRERREGSAGWAFQTLHGIATAS